MTDKTPPGPWDYLSKEGIDRAVAILETPLASTPATFDGWCNYCRAIMPHRELRYGSLVIWQCEMEAQHDQRKAA